MAGGLEQQGQPIPSPEEVPAVVAMIAEGRAVAPSREAMSRWFEVTERAQAIGHAGVVSAQDCAAAWRHIFEQRGAVSDAVLSAAATGLWEGDIRDALRCSLMDIGLSEADTPKEIKAFTDAGVRPDSTTGATLIEVARNLPDHLAAPTLCVLTEYAWEIEGNGAVANFAVDRAMQVRPTLGHAATLGFMINLGIRSRGER